MQVARTAEDLKPFRDGALVPTMGAMHAGHMALIRRACALRDSGTSGPVVVSIFVNPTQFNRPIDFETYPVRHEEDIRVCEEAGVDCVFIPPVDVVYPPGEEVPVPDLPDVVTKPGLEDRYRPGHFPGVAQVCTRLFELCRPSHALFGEKDWQQLALMRTISRRDNLGVEIVGCPTVREADGVALSSRNFNLSPEQRRRAVGIVRGLVEAGRHTDRGEAERAGAKVVEEHGFDLEYLAVRDAETLLDPREGRPARVLAAGLLGHVRLIDNAPWPGFTLP